jgi:hypothetical protein
MAASIYVAGSWRDGAMAHPPELAVWLDDAGIYWFLYRYFEAANLDRSRELIDLYGSAELDGYQLDRLEVELRSARQDVQFKPDQWEVLTGWNDTPAQENEIWQTVHKYEVLDCIDRLLALIDLARTQRLKLIVSGD